MIFHNAAELLLATPSRPPSQALTVRFLLGCENLTLDTRCRGRLSDPQLPFATIGGNAGPCPEADTATALKPGQAIGVRSFDLRVAMQGIYGRQQGAGCLVGLSRMIQNRLEQQERSTALRAMLTAKGRNQW
jgi:hypothetical protein